MTILSAKGGYPILAQLKTERNYIISQLEKLNKEVSLLPPGKLLISKNGRYAKCFLSNGTQPIYLPKTRISVAQNLALKKYYLLQINELSEQLKVINCCIDAYESIPNEADPLLDKESPYRNLIFPFLQDYQYSDIWGSLPYERSNEYPHLLIHQCLNGIMVRSKSELIIANSLFLNHVPFRYECKLILGDTFVYPDFTILHPRKRIIYYWEHFGLMDKSNYRDNNYNKLKLYGDKDIIPSINMITTFETSKNPINSHEIQKIIEKTFL